MLGEFEYAHPLLDGAAHAAQAGIAAAIGKGDTFEKHITDTIIAGAGIVDEEIASLMVREAPARIHDLLECGVPCDGGPGGKRVRSRAGAR